MQNSNLSHWEAKKVCFLGDSITDGIGVTKDRTYWSILEKDIGIRAYSYGLNGACFDNLLEQAKAMQAEHREEVDAIFLFAGTNDFYSSVSLGRWYDEVQKNCVLLNNADGQPIEVVRKYREFNFDINTFKGRINIVLSFLKQTYPYTQIVLMTPIHRAFATFGPNNIQQNEMYSNALGHFFDEYVKVIKEAANIWSVEIIDLNSVSGLFPLYDKGAERFFANVETDRLHPSFEGHRRLAQVIEYKMISIPVF